MIEVRPFDSLGGANHGWLNAKHHFSFANYYDPKRMSWGNLRVWNDDEIAAQPVDLQVRMTLGDPEASCQAALMNLGITLVSMPHALPHLDNGSLRRVLPDWYVDTGIVSIHFAAQKLLPQKTRVFVDFVVEQFRLQGLDKRFSAT